MFSPKQYKDRIKKWGLNKHIQKDEMEAMIRIRHERKMTDNKETIFLLRGRPVNTEKIDRYEKEHPSQNRADEDVAMDMGENPELIPSDIHYYTPKAGSPAPQDTASTHDISRPEAGALSESMVPNLAAPIGYPASASGQTQVPYTYSQTSSPPMSQFHPQYQVTSSL
jgi:hypothetical protein